MKIEKRHLLNYSILIPYLILSIIGLIVVYSTTSALAIQSGVSSIRMVRTQGLFFILSLLTIALIYKFSLNFLRNKKVLAFVIFKRLALADLDSDWNRCDYAGLGKCDDLGLNGLDHDYG